MKSYSVAEEPVSADVCIMKHALKRKVQETNGEE